MLIIEITELKQYGHIVFLNANKEWEIKELGITFKTNQEAERYLNEKYEKIIMSALNK